MTVRLASVLSLSATCAVLLLSGCGGGAAPTAATSPSVAPTPDPVVTVANQYFDDISKSDCPDVYALFDQEARDALGSQSDYCSTLKPDNRSVSVGAVTHDGANEATVAVTVTKLNGDVHHDDMDLVETGGSWLVDNLRPDNQPKGYSVLNFDDVVSQIESQYQHNTGYTVTVTCPLSGQQDVKVATAVTCSFANPEGVSGHIQVTATTFNGSVWHTVGAVTTPMPQAPATSYPTT